MMINATCARTPRHPLHVKEKAKLIGYNALVPHVSIYTATFKTKNKN